MFENVHVDFGQFLRNLRKSLESDRKSSENCQKRRNQYVYVINKIIHGRKLLEMIACRYGISLLVFNFILTLEDSKRYFISTLSPRIILYIIQFLYCMS